MLWAARSAKELSCRIRIFKMITCKEDLVNTYIENDKGVLRDVYVSLCLLHGINHQYHRNRDNNWYDSPYVGVSAAWSSKEIGQAYTNSLGLADCKQLTLTDLLPTSYENTKVYSLDEDVIRKYAELCGVEIGPTCDSRLVAAGFVRMGIGAVNYFVSKSQVDTEEDEYQTLTPEQILAAWDLKFVEEKTRTESEYQAVVKECDSYKNACNLNSLIITDMDGNTVDFDTCEGVVELPFSLESLKQYKQPKTKTKFEYVKCHNSKAIKGVMNGDDNYWCKSGESYVHLNMDSPLEQFCRAYRRTEVEIDWRDECVSYFKTTPDLHEDDCLIDLINENATSREQKALLEMCRVALRATGELTPKP